MAFQMWESLAGGPGPRGCDWTGNDLQLAASGQTTITIPAADLRDLMIFLLDVSVRQEFRQARGDKYVQARNALGGSAGATLSGFTASVVLDRGVVLVQASGGEEFDVGEALSFVTMLASLAQSRLKAEAGLLMRS